MGHACFVLLASAEDVTDGVAKTEASSRALPPSTLCSSSSSSAADSFSGGNMDGERSNVSYLYSAAAFRPFSSRSLQGDQFIQLLEPEASSIIQILMISHVRSPP